MNVNKIASALTSNKFLKKAVINSEYDGFNMPMTSLLITLYGATLIPRYINAYDEHDRKEILTRDLVTMTSILFGSRALKKIISKISTKITGIALAKLPEKNHNTLLQKIFNYLRPEKGVQVLGSDEVIGIYSKLNKKNNGFLNLLKFNDKNGGNLSKFLLKDEKVKNASEKIIGKNIENLSNKEILDTFAKTTNTNAMNEIYDVFDNTKNNYVRKAKRLNGAFDFISTLIVIPAGMILLQKYNQNKTQKRIEAELLRTNAQENESISKEQKLEKIEKIETKNLISAKNSSEKNKQQVFKQFLD